MEKVLIMGGSYFIGKHVVNALKDDYAVTVLNRGNKPFNMKNIEELVCDRNDHAALRKVLSRHHADFIVDISGITQQHAEGLLNAIDLTTVKKLIYISSSAVYDINKSEIPFLEAAPLGGESPFKAYADHKRHAEQYLLKALDRDKFVAFRPPFVYGEDNYVLRERLMFYLIEQNEPIFIPATNNKIQFVYVKDLANQIKEALQGVIPAGIYNVGDSDALTFIQWVELCGQVVGKKPNTLLVDPQKLTYPVTAFFPFFDYDNVLSVDKIKQYSHVSTPFIKGLKHAYEDYQSLKETIKLPDVMREARKILKGVL